MRLIYWLDKCPFTGRDRSAVESLIPNVAKVKLTAESGEAIYIAFEEGAFQIQTERRIENVDQS